MTTPTETPEVRLVVRDGCPYCVAARRWFDERGLEYTLETKNDPAERQAFYDAIGLVGGDRTVPQIWVNEERIGGFMDLQRSDFARNY